MAEVKRLGLAGRGGGVRINKAGCLDRCAGRAGGGGLPRGRLVHLVDQSDLDEIISSHLQHGRVVERLVLPDTVGR